jgi:hypothetical protein
MSRVIVKRRQDGIVQIRRRPRWRAIAGPVPATMLGFLLLFLLGLALLATALVHFPMLLLLIGGLVALSLSAVRFAWQERDPGLRARPPPRPPRDAA